MSSTAPARLRASHIAAVTAGNGLEFYDFLVYATFAVYIGKTYFPAHDPTTSLLLSLATFGIGFTTRPLGGVVIGWFGDRAGRRPAMLLSFLLMGVGLAGLALTPGYERIGPAAPVLAVLFRLVQGFALGGEVGPATAFLVEAAGPGRRGLSSSLQSASQGAAAVLAALAGVILAATLAPRDLEAWGWRIALLLGVAIVPFGLVARRTLPETLHGAGEAAPSSAPPPVGVAALGLMMVGGGTISTYVALYMPTYAIHTLHMPPGIAFATGIVWGAVILVVSPLGGMLSDRFGRRAVVIPGYVAALVLGLATFMLLARRPSAATLYLAVALPTIPTALATGPMICALTESLPAKARSTGLGVVYALAVAVFGGSAQFVVAWLIEATHDPVAPGYYRAAAGLVALAGVLMLPESSPTRRRAALTPSLAPDAAPG